jgi:hypothetical protein
MTDEDEALWLDWCEEVGHDPNEREEITGCLRWAAISKERWRKKHIKSLLDQIRRAAHEALETGAAPEELQKVIETAIAIHNSFSGGNWRK